MSTKQKRTPGSGVGRTLKGFTERTSSNRDIAVVMLILGLGIGILGTATVQQISAAITPLAIGELTTDDIGIGSWFRYDYYSSGEISHPVHVIANVTGNTTYGEPDGEPLWDTATEAPDKEYLLWDLTVRSSVHNTVLLDEDGVMSGGMDMNWTIENAGVVRHLLSSYYFRDGAPPSLFRATPVYRYIRPMIDTEYQIETAEEYGYVSDESPLIESEGDVLKLVIRPLMERFFGFPISAQYVTRYDIEYDYNTGVLLLLRRTVEYANGNIYWTQLSLTDHEINKPIVNEPEKPPEPIISLFEANDSDVPYDYMLSVSSEPSITYTRVILNSHDQSVIPSYVKNGANFVGMELFVNGTTTIDVTCITWAGPLLAWNITKSFEVENIQTDYELPRDDDYDSPVAEFACNATSENNLLFVEWDNVESVSSYTVVINGTNLYSTTNTNVTFPLEPGADRTYHVWILGVYDNGTVIESSMDSVTVSVDEEAVLKGQAKWADEPVSVSMILILAIVGAIIIAVGGVLAYRQRMIGRGKSITTGRK